MLTLTSPVITSVFLASVVVCNQQFEVLKISNVPFPINEGAVPLANLPFANGSYHKEIAEFTVCYRFMIESYNMGKLDPMCAYRKKDYYKPNFYNNIGWETGHEREGYQGGQVLVYRNIPPKPVSKGGLDNRPFPTANLYVLPRNIDPSKWYHQCHSYSSIAQRAFSYQDGLKIYGFNYGDEKDDPLDPDFFGDILFGYNMRGFITDAHIFNSFFDEASQISWTTACNDKQGEIFSWDPNKINITQVDLFSVANKRQPDSFFCQSKTLCF